MWVELRVHGVSGAPPESLLDFDCVRQVGGDESSRFFRRFDEYGAELFDDDPGPGRHAVEAFHWGRFTSGSWTQAFWLLLAPFGAVNAAQFMLPAPGTGRQRVAHAIAGAMLRLIGLALTLLIVLAAAVVLLDLLAWQRLGVTPPAALPSGPGFRAAATGGLAACGLVLLALSLLTRSSREDEALPSGPLTAQLDPPTDLVRPGFFQGAAKAGGLRMLHSAAGLAMLGVIGAGAACQAGIGGSVVVLDVALAVLAATVLAVLLAGDPGQSASVVWGDRRLDGVRDRVHGLARRAAPILLGFGGLTFVLGVIWLGMVGTRPSDAADSHFPMIETLAGYAVYVGAGALVVLFLAALVLRAPHAGPEAFRPYANGLAAPLAASLGVFLGVGYTAAVTVLVSNLLNGLTATFRLDADPGTYAGQVPDVLARAVRTEVHAPELLSRIVHAWGITAVATLLLAVAAGIGWFVTRTRARDRVLADAGDLLPPRWVTKVGTAMWIARLKNHLVAVLATYSGLGLVLSVVTAVELGLPGQTPWDIPGLGWLSASEAHPGPGSGALLWLGSAVLALLAAALVTVGRLGVRDGSTRRAANVIWDVVAFWPRSVHPFVPPAYSQWAVPDLTARVRHLGHDLVLCGHSQGSLIAFAALLRMGEPVAARPGTLDPAPLAGVGLLTFGSQLQVVFARAFPAYVNLPTLQWLHAGVGTAWRNLYRETDHLAGPVLSWDHRWAYDDPTDVPLPGQVAVGAGTLPGSGVPAGAGARPLPPPGSQSGPPPGGDGRPWRTAFSFTPGTGPAPSPADGPRGGRRREFGPDWCLPDPPLPDPPGGPDGASLQETPLLDLRRHGAYWRDPAWTEALAAIRATAPAPDGARAPIEPAGAAEGRAPVGQDRRSGEDRDSGRDVSSPPDRSSELGGSSGQE